MNLKSLASNYGSDVDIINEDGELATAYEAQKGINRYVKKIVKIIHLTILLVSAVSYFGRNSLFLILTSQ